MSFWLLFYQSVFVLSIWCWACWPLHYFLYTQLYHEMALRVADVAELTLNVLGNGDTAPCPFLWLSGVEPAPALILLGWMLHCSCLRISQSICVGWADICMLGHSLCPGKIQSKVTVLNHLVDCLSQHWMISWGLIAIIFSSQDFYQHLHLLIMRKTSPPALHKLLNAKIAAKANDKKMLLDLTSRSQWDSNSSYCRPDEPM